MKAFEGISDYYCAVLEEAAKSPKNINAKAGPSLRGHIVSTHLLPDVLAWMGVAEFDLRLLRLMEEPGDWIVKKIYETLEQGWQDRAEAFDRPRQLTNPGVFKNLALPWNENWANMLLAKQLLFIERLELAQVDWDRVIAKVPSAEGLTLNLAVDAYDPLVRKAQLITFPANVKNNRLITNKSEIILQDKF